MDMRYQIILQPDFVAQRCAIEELVHARGHLVLFSVNCHPETAGDGIEYDWGVSKLTLRGHLNNVNGGFEKFKESCFKSMTAHGDIVDKCGNVREAPLSISKTRKYARKARTYRRAHHVLGPVILKEWKKMMTIVSRWLRG